MVPGSETQHYYLQWFGGLGLQSAALPPWRLNSTCCVVLCCALLCCVVLCCLVLSCAVLCCLVLCCLVLCCDVMCVVLLCVVLLCVMGERRMRQEEGGREAGEGGGW